MKTLSSYKKAYSAAKTRSTLNKVFNSAMINLDYYDQQEFVKWQSNR